MYLFLTLSYFLVIDAFGYFNLADSQKFWIELIVLHKNWNIPLGISLVNVNKPPAICGFVHIYIKILLDLVFYLCVITYGCNLLTIVKSSHQRCFINYHRETLVLEFL